MIWVLQLPQACGSELTSTQLPLHIIFPTGQMHCPEMHDSPGLHWLPHAPQWFGSLDRSTQPAKPQFTCPGTGQTHWPETHVWPGLHWLPHMPQWFGSLVVLTHPMAPPQ